MEYNKAIKKKAKLRNLKPERQFYTHFSYEKSVFTDQFVIGAQSYYITEKEISNMVISKVVHSNTSDKKCVEPLVLVYLHCLLIDLPFALSPTNFYHLIKGESIVYNDLICFEYTQEKLGVIRYFPNSFSLLLINKLRGQLSKVVPSKVTINIAQTKILTELHKKNKIFPKSLPEFKKVTGTGCIFNQSPAFNEYRKGKIFKQLPTKIRKLERINEK
jgi:hypothetical protein